MIGKINTYDPFDNSIINTPSLESHGTEVSCIAAGNTDESNGWTASVGFNCGMVAYLNTGTITGWIEKAVDAALVEHVKVINFSLEGVGSLTYQNYMRPEWISGIKEILDSGVVIVRSAGNDSLNDGLYDRLPFSPVIDDRIIVVSATNFYDSHIDPTSDPAFGLATYCHYPEVTICAPGYYITTGTTLIDVFNPNSFYPGNKEIWGGTSAATPIVFGVCALMKSINPNLTVAEVKAIIQATADPIIDEYMYSGLLGAGRINAYKAVKIVDDCYTQPVLEKSITSNVTCLVPMRTSEPIIIENGGVLTINSTLKCSENSYIKVKPGGKLIINGGTLKNGCIENNWQGIIVEGTSTQSQMGVAPNQGIVILNGAIIENAVCGIKVGDQSDLSKSGGIVYATNTTFKNCINGVIFESYKNMINNNEISNRSKFTNCEFLVDNDFNFPHQYFDAHVKLHGVNGIVFTGCSFNCDLTTPYGANENDLSRIGISSFNSGFTVKPQCTTSVLGFGAVCSCNNIVNQSKFKGFDYAIIAEASENPFFVDIQSSNFEDNENGVVLKGINNPRILNNTFSIDKSCNPRNSASFGVKIENSFDFRIEDNTFSKSDLSCGNYVIGLLIKNSGKHNNEVYNNSFYNLNIGQAFTGMNYSPVFPDRGLLSLCNYNENNIKYDIFVSPSTIFSQTGINQYQCNSSNTFNGLSAGNTFTDEGNVEIQYCNSSNPTINYFFDPNISNHKPTTTCNLLTFEALPYECASRLYSFDIIDVQTELTTVRQNLNNLKYNYNLLIDAGNSEELLDLVQGDWSEDVWDLRTELLSNSPYLSKEILRTVAEENQLPQALYLEICLANPDATKDEEFLNFLRYDISNPLPEYMIELIIASWETKTLRTEMEEQLSTVNTRNDFLSNTLTSYLLADTTYNYSTITSQIQSRGSSNDYLTLSEIAIIQNDFVAALDYIYFIENHIPDLSKEEQDEIVSFKDYINFRESVNQSGKTIYNLDSNQLLTLKSYAIENDFRGCELAKSILCMLYNDCIDEPFAEPKTLQTTNGRNSFSKAKNISIADVTVMPNPATTFATFEWDLKSYPDQAILYIYDQMGKMITSKLIETNQGQWVWDTRNYPNGAYIYILKSEKYILNSGKIIVNK